MNKTTLNILLIILMAMSLGSCTRNHGDIGIWFGTWQVEQITEGGVPKSVDGNYFFQFQNKVFRVSKVSGHDDLIESFGTWEENGDKMTISFPDPNVFYIQMPGLEVHNDFTVTTTSSREVTFTKTESTTGTIYTYRLRKNP